MVPRRSKRAGGLRPGRAARGGGCARHAADTQAPEAPFPRYGAGGTSRAAPRPGWLARFAPTYAEELDRFVVALEGGRAPEPASLEDGLAAQRLAEAAGRSIREGRRIRLEA